MPCAQGVSAARRAHGGGAELGRRGGSGSTSGRGGGRAAGRCAKQRDGDHGPAGQDPPPGAVAYGGGGAAWAWRGRDWHRRKEHHHARLRPQERPGGHHHGALAPHGPPAPAPHDRKRIIALVASDTEQGNRGGGGGGGGGGGTSPPLLVEVDNEKDDSHTVITVTCHDVPGLLTEITSALQDLHLDVARAEVGKSSDGFAATDIFYVTDVRSGSKVDLPRVENVRSRLYRIVAFALGVDVSRWSDSLEACDKDLLFSMMDSYVANDIVSIQRSIISHVEYTIGRSRYKFDDFEAYLATSHSVRDRLIESWNDTQKWFHEKDSKRIYYLSMEFLTGRTLTNALSNLELKGRYTESLAQLGHRMETLADKERDAALGNGGLGRLAACFLDSMATLDLPAWGYGIRYQYGMFRQSIVDGFQKEHPDYWLNFGNPWEIERPNVRYPVKFYGHVSVRNVDGEEVFVWNPGEVVDAVAYDNPIPGYRTPNTINLRLWSAKPSREFDLESFNTGDYIAAILNKQRAEAISSILYPDDRTHEGKELRLKQQFFLCSASLQDCVRRYCDDHDTFEEFPSKCAFQLNDTHPTIAIPELMRLLMDEHFLGWNRAWEITTRVFSFTNHTVLPEALEKWPVMLLESLLPRHMQIIYDINWRFMQRLRDDGYGDDSALLGRLSIIEETRGGNMVRMAFLSMVASHTVNGVAAIHSELIKHTIFRDFYAIWPDKFQNKTNGVPPRRWLASANEPLASLITETLGTDEWVMDLELLSRLRAKADCPELQARWREVKDVAKAKLAQLIFDTVGVRVPAGALYDVHVKRIHEYKRQLLNVFGVVHRYDRIKGMTAEERAGVVPRVVIFGGKAAPGYEMAKRIIKLISAVSEKVNNDEEVGDLLKVVFLPDYNVSLAEVIVPGAEVSQHISTAGTEASGTSNMKFAMNGSLVLGTYDGATIEIAEEVGRENLFLFGTRSEDVDALRARRGELAVDPRFHHVLGLVRGGHFGWSDFFTPLVQSVEGHGDFYLCGVDFQSYVDVQDEVDEVYRDQREWMKRSILHVAGSGKFSSDRTIAEYAREIWDVHPSRLPPGRYQPPREG